MASISTLVNKNTAPAGQDAPSDSTVSWYLLIWILFSLASNSMAQPSGRICGASIRYHVYLCSSPLFCFADGLSILIRLIVASIYLRTSPLKASLLAILSRADERHHSKRNDGASFDDSFLATANEVTPPGNTATWPRRLFFLLATVPAVIQLASFKGLPITQTLGLMFVSSFIIIELVTFFSNFEERRSIPEVLSYVKLEEAPAEEQEIRSKVFRMIKGLEWTETCLFMMTLHSLQ